MMQKHIVISALSARRGGGKTYLNNILRYIPENYNLDVTILISNKYEIETLPFNVSKKVINFPVDNPIYRVIWEVFFLPHYLRKNKVDVFFCPGGVIPAFGFGAWKTVTMFRNMIPFDLEQRKNYPLGYMRLRNWILSKSMLRSMESADLVIFISNFARQIINMSSKKGLKKAITIHHGVGEEFKKNDKNIETRPQYLPNDNYIVYPSIIDVYKSQKELIKAISILKDRGIELPKVLLVGELYGKYARDIIKMIQKFRLQEHVIIFGSVPYKDMPSLYFHADFVIFASKSENCPNILLEALASSSAILCSNKMPMPEFAAEAVEYFDPCDPNSIADKINFLIEQPLQIIRLKELSTNQGNKFHWSNTAKETWKALASI